LRAASTAWRWWIRVHSSPATCGDLVPEPLRHKDLRRGRRATAVAADSGPADEAAEGRPGRPGRFGLPLLRRAARHPRRVERPSREREISAPCRAQRATGSARRWTSPTPRPDTGWGWPFEDTSAYRWLLEHSHGFVLARHERETGYQGGVPAPPLQSEQRTRGASKRRDLSPGFSLMREGWCLLSRSW